MIPMQRFAPILVGTQRLSAGVGALPTDAPKATQGNPYAASVEEIIADNAKTIALVKAMYRPAPGIGALLEGAEATAADIAFDAGLCALGPEGAAVAFVLNIIGIKGSDIVNFCASVFGKSETNARGLTKEGEAAKLFEENYDPSAHDDAWRNDRAVDSIAGHYTATIGPGLGKKILLYYYGGAGNPGGLRAKRELAAIAAEEAAKAKKIADDAKNKAAHSYMGAGSVTKGLNRSVFFIPDPTPEPAPLPAATAAGAALARINPAIAKIDAPILASTPAKVAAGGIGLGLLALLVRAVLR